MQSEQKAFYLPIYAGEPLANRNSPLPAIALDHEAPFVEPRAAVARQAFAEDNEFAPPPL